METKNNKKYILTGLKLVRFLVVALLMLLSSAFLFACANTQASVFTSANQPSNQISSGINTENETNSTNTENNQTTQTNVPETTTPENNQTSGSGNISGENESNASDFYVYFNVIVSDPERVGYEYNTESTELPYTISLGNNAFFPITYYKRCKTTKDSSSSISSLLNFAGKIGPITCYYVSNSDGAVKSGLVNNISIAALTKKITSENNPLVGIGFGGHGFNGAYYLQVEIEEEYQLKIKCLDFTGLTGSNLSNNLDERINQAYSNAQYYKYHSITVGRYSVWGNPSEPDKKYWSTPSNTYNGEGNYYCNISAEVAKIYNNGATNYWDIYIHFKTKSSVPAGAVFMVAHKAYGALRPDMDDQKLTYQSDYNNTYQGKGGTDTNGLIRTDGDATTGLLLNMTQSIEIYFVLTYRTEILMPSATTEIYYETSLKDGALLSIGSNNGTFLGLDAAIGIGRFDSVKYYDSSSVCLKSASPALLYINDYTKKFFGNIIPYGNISVNNIFPRTKSLNASCSTIWDLVDYKDGRYRIYLNDYKFTANVGADLFYLNNFQEAINLMRLSDWSTYSNIASVAQTITLTTLVADAATGIDVNVNLKNNVVFVSNLATDDYILTGSPNIRFYTDSSSSLSITWKSGVIDKLSFGYYNGGTWDSSKKTVSTLNITGGLVGEIYVADVANSPTINLSDYGNTSTKLTSLESTATINLKGKVVLNTLKICGLLNNSGVNTVYELDYSGNKTFNLTGDSSNYIQTHAFYNSGTGTVNITYWHGKNGAGVYSDYIDSYIDNNSTGTININLVGMDLHYQLTNIYNYGGVVNINNCCFTGVELNAPSGGITNINCSGMFYLYRYAYNGTSQGYININAADVRIVKNSIHGVSNYYSGGLKLTENAKNFNLAISSGYGLRYSKNGFDELNPFIIMENGASFYSGSEYTNILNLNFDDIPDGITQVLVGKTATQTQAETLKSLFAESYFAEDKLGWSSYIKQNGAYEVWVDLTGVQGNNKYKFIYSEDELRALVGGVINGATTDLNNDFYGTETIFIGADISVKEASGGWDGIFSVANITIDGSGNTIYFENASMGLIQTIGSNVVVQNLAIAGKIDGASGTAVGGIAGTISSGATNININNCYFRGKISATNANVGGIVGTVSGGATITNCISNGIINGVCNESSKNYGISGIVGGLTNSNSHIINCMNFSSLTADKYLYVSGIAVNNTTTSSHYDIEHCYTFGTITSKNDTDYSVVGWDSHNSYFNCKIILGTNVYRKANDASFCSFYSLNSSSIYATVNMVKKNVLSIIKGSYNLTVTWYDTDSSTSGTQSGWKVDDVWANWL